MRPVGSLHRSRQWARAERTANSPGTETRPAIATFVGPDLAQPPGRDCQTAW